VTLRDKKAMAWAGAEYARTQRRKQRAYFAEEFNDLKTY
jgi:hypothetical protein